jgi:hypothetical protein
MAPGESITRTIVVIESTPTSTLGDIGEYFGFEFIETGTDTGSPSALEACGYAICGDSGYSGYSGCQPSYLEWKKLQERRKLLYKQLIKPRILHLPKLIEHRVRSSCK